MAIPNLSFLQDFLDLQEAQGPTFNLLPGNPLNNPDDYDISNMLPQWTTGPPAGVEELEVVFAFGNGLGQQSTMDWHRHNVPAVYECLQHAAAFFRYHMATRMPYYSTIHASYNPSDQRRYISQICWELACAQYTGNRDLEKSWMDSKGQWWPINQDVIFETVRLQVHISLPEKSSFSRIQHR